MLIASRGLPQSLVEHDDVGGDHRKRAIPLYGCNGWSSRRLVERCDSPVEKRKGGAIPVYYRATGTDVPEGFRKKRETSIHRNSVSQLQNDCTGTDSIDKPVLSQLDDCHNSSGSTATEACTTEMEQESCDKDSCDKTPVVNQNDSGATDSG